jgi:hypothetical protein
VIVGQSDKKIRQDFALDGNEPQTRYYALASLHGQVLDGI